MNDKMKTPHHFRDMFPLWDRSRYLIWSLSKSKARLSASLRDGVKILMRARPARDWETAYEVLFERIYELPEQMDRHSVRRIVDLGGNVGYSCLFWAQLCPNAAIQTYEPHPVHAAILREHLKLNSLAQRVELIEEAAGPIASHAFLTDNDVNSRVYPGSAGTGSLPITVCDFFQRVGGAPIDVLKIDIEGGEYPLLQDPRFETLQVRFLVMEFHGVAGYPNPKQWCGGRLQAAGYSIQKSPDSHPQLIRASRPG